MELGKNIIKIRKQNNLTQDDFAEKYFVTRQTVSNWENSKSYPDLETLIKISDDFDISLDILLKEDNKMIKDISKKQRNYKFINLFVAILNIVGILLLLYFAIPYIFNIRSLNDYSWETCGFILILGFIPLLITNIMAYVFFKFRNNKISLLLFIPSLLCMILVSHYLFIPHQESNDNQEFYGAMKCYLNDENYKFQIYKNDNNEFTIEMDEKYRIPSSEIDSTNVKTIFDSIERYFKNNGGGCP